MTFTLLTDRATPRPLIIHNEIIGGHLCCKTLRCGLCSFIIGNPRACRAATDRSESILCTPACCNLRGVQHSLKNDAILFRPLLQST